MMSSARPVVFCSVYNKGIVEHVRALNQTAAVHLSEEGEYRLGMYRPDMYRRMAETVIAAARGGRGVVVLAPGSAMVVDLVTQHLLDGAHDAGLRVRILPGISSVESVLAEVGYDVSGGLQVVLAHKLVLHGLELNPTMASIVLQPAYFDTQFFAGAPTSVEGRFDALEQRLACTFSRQAPMALVITPTEVDDGASVFWFRLGALGRLFRVLTPRHTLFVPPERAAPADPAFAARASSWQECLSRLQVDGRGALLQQNRRAIHAGVLELPADLLAESDALAAQWRARPR